LSACQSHQLSADAYIENRFNGAFTHYLLKNLANNGFNKNLQEIVSKVHADLSKNGFDQIPEFEGQLTKSSFFL
jgi:poly-D-alanine transfer protein DltD